MYVCFCFVVTGSAVIAAKFQFFSILENAGFGCNLMHSPACSGCCSTGYFMKPETLHSNVFLTGMGDGTRNSEPLLALPWPGIA